MSGLEEGEAEENSCIEQRGRNQAVVKGAHLQIFVFVFLKLLSYLFIKSSPFGY